MTSESHETAHNTGAAGLVLGATGVVFGDIGTSPIYALHETFAKSGTSLPDIFGVVSLVFWSLMLVVSIKYLSFVMRADNDGEGGILALLSLLPTVYRNPTNRKQSALLILVLIGTALLFGDGVLTPAISVLSATEGLSLVNEGLSHSSVPITVVILVLLFAVQRRGTHRIGQVFGPIMVLWFGTIAVLGAIRLFEHPDVIKALSPTYAIAYIHHHGFHSVILLSSIILCVTGAEALYADMGHFGARPIRMAWWILVGPSLVLCYLGQAALVAEHPEAISNPFFSLPTNTGVTFFLVLLATAATVIASQALITGVFSLSQQAIQLGLFPRLFVSHTSVEHSGQIYVPVVNWLVGGTSIILVITFKTSTALAHAYVLAIAGTMSVTTIAFHKVATEVWKWPKSRTYPLTTLFLIVDLAFLAGTSANLFKGGWVPVLLGSFVLGIMLLWRKGYQALNHYMADRAIPWSDIHEEIGHGSLYRVPGIGIYLAGPNEQVPAALISQTEVLHSMPSEILVVTVRSIPAPYSDGVVSVEKILPRVHKMTIPVGYMEQVKLPEILRANHLGQAERSATYYLSERKFHATDANRVSHWPELLFSILHRNATSPVQYFGLPAERVITIGTRIDL
ncbi:MAG: KUP/HAK/KT family potassium transporter [Actinomycetes bacterium]